jgi:hypothetical protein
MKLRNLLVVLLVGVISVQGNNTALGPKAYDEWFSSYSAVSWAEEKSYLLGFSVFLRQNSEMIGYIAFCGDSKMELRLKRERAKRAKKYMRLKFKIAADRVVLVEGKNCKVNLTILQPMSKSELPPRFF